MREDKLILFRSYCNVFCNEQRRSKIKMWEYIQTHLTRALLPNDWLVENQAVKNSLLDCIAPNSD